MQGCDEWCTEFAVRMNVRSALNELFGQWFIVPSYGLMQNCIAIVETNLVDRDLCSMTDAL
jgi:hypothetical protein